MTQRLDDATARLLLEQWGTWFGPPPIEFRGAMIDGRVRLREAVSLGISKKVPKPLKLELASDAAKYLALAGHYDRAREHVPSELTDVRDVAAYCHCDVELVAPLCVKARLIVPRMKTHTTPARRRAIERMHQLLVRAEQSSGTILADDLRKALAQWL